MATGSEYTRRALIEAAGAALASCLVRPAALAQGRDRATGGPEKLDNMIIVPAGTFLKGTSPEQAQQLAALYGFHSSWLDGEVPQIAVSLPGFRIDRHPVTVAEYALFCFATGNPMPPYWDALPSLTPYLHHPVREMSWKAAERYATWVGKRLPTEDEWEKAARGTDGRLFPWGDAFDPDACQWNRYGTPAGPDTARIGSHPLGDSPYGVADMAGNVAEWCADGPTSEVAWVKGGGWYTESVLNLRPAARNMSAYRNIRGIQFGFRCAEDWP